ncbi:disease resistance protein RUN1-like [Vitis riparia]|uniref:disease resistance protein RUN1-like n=1 Tax=Vitis riparia TaxID=96939 RepID=UPI00155A2B35|nr:disease resistance protein RUN1-like [Vitis riparia]
MTIKSKDVPEDVLMVGICGLDGVGKSTMAKAIYNELCYPFKSKSFLDKVGDVSKEPHGLLDLQQQLLCDISPRGEPQISTLDQGIIVLQRMLHREKVLLVIDGVNAKEQLEKLAGGHDWCLLTISNGKVGMHNLIQKLGHKIVRDESLWDKGIRSRLWHHMDVQDVLEERMKGTKSIEGILLDLSKLDNINLSTQAMTDMTQLRLLKIFLGSEVVSGEEDCKVCIKSDFKFPSGNLCYLYWHGYPLNSLPSNFDPAKLVELNMPYSNIRKFGLGKMVSNLTAIILSHSKDLVMVSNFSSTPNLEKLILEGCTSLREIDPSIGDLERLGLLDLKECKSLGSLPDSICNLKSLKTLYLSGCSELNGLPKDLGNMTHLTELYANRTATGAPPSAIRRIRKFLIPPFSGYKGGRAYPSLSSLPGLSLLRELDLSDCYWWDAKIPYDFWRLYSLEKLNLSGNPITIMPASIKELSRLKVLVLGRCKRLQSLPKLPPSLQELDAHECVSLSYVVKKHAPESQFCILVPGDKVPAWFDFRGEKSSTIFPGVKVPARFDFHPWEASVAIHSGDLLGIWVCFVFAFKDQLPQIHDDISCRLNNFSFFYSYRDKWSGEHSSNRHMWLAYQPCSAFDICFPETWRNIEASFELSGVTDASEIERGIHLIYRKYSQKKQRIKN